MLDELRRDAARLARLVDDLLVLERQGAGAGAEAEPGREPVSLDELVRDAVIGRERVRADVVEELSVVAEEEAIRRALENLIDNALVYGPPGGEVTVSLLERDGNAWLTVRDQGPGPDPSQRERLFERFWRGAGAGARPGSGLGLSIVAAIAERYGGHIHVDGSAFTIELPGARRAERVTPPGARR